MRVFLTGGRGMVGRAILAHPDAQSHQITSPTSVQLNLCDRTAVDQALADAKPDMVIHAAGRVGGIQANMADPAGFLSQNMEMGLNILQASQAAGVPQVLNLGSSCMYPHNAENPLREEQLGTGQLEPTNEGYALAKLAVARMGDFMTTQGQLACKTLIPCNLYGLWDNFDPVRSHLVPAIIRKVHEAKQDGAATIEIWGDGTARREFMFTGDLADAIWQAVARFDNLPPAMTMGVGKDHSINEYYRVVADVLGWSGEFTHDINKPAGMKQKLMSDTRQQAFGWTPTHDLQSGLQKTYDYFLAEHADV